MDHEIGGVATGLTTFEISVAHSMQPPTARRAPKTDELKCWNRGGLCHALRTGGTGIQ